MSRQRKVAKRAVMYLRVACATQTPDDQLARQRQACETVARRLGVEIVSEYADIGSSARCTERPGLQYLLRRCANNDIHYVIASDDARFSRNVHHTAELYDTLRRHGTRIVTNLSAPANKFYSTIAGVMAELDHHERSERIKAGRAKHRIASTVKGGRHEHK